mmetsp:Transcript_53828/g.125833  ORF Transcript_53828/g.125833 Transcript_53828/m.125833 type:complete len:414 (+) Transcript_53828:51-1292(+)
MWWKGLLLTFLGGSHAATTSTVPVDYYSLLGLRRFTSDPKEIKRAHRRMVKLVHPDILGPEAAAVQGLVSEAYSTLSDTRQRAKYDQTLQIYNPRHGRSRWAEDAPSADTGLRPAFVDETICEGCLNCVDIAGNTFRGGVSPDERGKAHVFMQFGDSAEVINAAVKNCPTKAISYVPRRDLGLLEYAQMQARGLHRAYEATVARGFVNTRAPLGPFELAKEYREMDCVDELLSIIWDEGEEAEAARLEEGMQILDEVIADEGGAEILAEKAKEIEEAVSQIPKLVQKKAWAEAVAANEGEFNEKISEMGRADLIRQLFRVLDMDEDSFLNQWEFERFARQVDPDLIDEYWQETFAELCEVYGRDPSTGVDLQMLAELVNDRSEGSCYRTDEDLRALCNVVRGVLLTASSSVDA